MKGQECHVKINTSSTRNKMANVDKTIVREVRIGFMYIAKYALPLFTRPLLIRFSAKNPPTDSRFDQIGRRSSMILT